MMDESGRTRMEMKIFWANVERLEMINVVVVLSEE